MEFLVYFSVNSNGSTRNCSRTSRVVNSRRQKIEISWTTRTLVPEVLAESKCTEHRCRPLRMEVSDENVTAD